MSALVTEQVRKHSSNPVRINLSEAPTSQLNRLAKRFRDEGLKLTFQGNQGDTYEFLSTASENNTHAGQVYRIIVGRSSAQEPVTGSCSCTWSELCKHLSAAYLDAQEIRRQHHIEASKRPFAYQTRFCTCGAEFLLGEGFESENCFDCLTNPARFPFPGRQVQHDVHAMTAKATCYWCDKLPESESLSRWVGPDGGIFYAHASCVLEARKLVKHG